MASGSITHHLILLIIILCWREGCSGAKITSMLVPKWVQNGTEEQIILDCDYDVDLSRDKNLTIKWYFRDKTELIYEWIPRLDFRYVSGRLQGRFNWDFVLNTSHMPSLKKYRAIAIRKPTTEMSGRYICQVLSTAGDDSEEATMVIYAPPEKIEFTSKSIKEEKKILITYKVEKVYPLPAITIYQSCPRDSSSLNEDEVGTDSDVKRRTAIIHESSVWSNGGGPATVTFMRPSVEGLNANRRMIGGDGEDESMGLNGPPIYTLQHVQYIDWEDIQINYEKNGCEVEKEDLPVIFDLKLSIPGTDFVAGRSLQFFPDSIESDEDQDNEDGDDQRQGAAGEPLHEKLTQGNSGGFSRTIIVLSPFYTAIIMMIGNLFLSIFSSGLHFSHSTFTS